MVPQAITTRVKRNLKPSADAPWYAPNRSLVGPSAADRARRLADRIAVHGSLSLIDDETAVFSAMHTCAYQAGRAKAGSPARRQWFARWRSIRDHIFEANLGLVYSMFTRFNSAQADTDELTSQAMLGLSRAVEKFDPFKGYRFSTYACNCIARACMRERKHERRRQDLFPVNFDVPWDLASEPRDHATELHVERLQHVLSCNEAQLTPIERRVLSKRFPTGDGPTLTFKQIACSVGLSKERVRQIQIEALGKLRETLAQDPVLQ